MSVYQENEAALMIVIIDILKCVQFKKHNTAQEHKNLFAKHALEMYLRFVNGM